MAGTFHGAPVLDVPGVGPVEVGFELLVATQEDSGAAAAAAAGQAPQVVVTVPRVGIVLEAVAVAEAAAADEGAGEDDEHSLPSLPPNALQPPAAAAAPLQPRAMRRRLEGEVLLRALGHVVPRLMWH